MTERNTREQQTAFNNLCATASQREIEEALRGGASPTACDGDRWTPLIWAARANPDPKAVLTLIAAGADLEARDESGLTALSWAAWCNRNPRVALALVEKGADLESRGFSG